MLRRRLFYFFGPLITVLLVTAVGAGWMMERALSRLNSMDTSAWAAIDRVNQVHGLLSQVHAQLHRMEVEPAFAAKSDQSLTALSAELIALTNTKGDCCKGSAEPICTEIRAAIPNVDAALRAVTQSDTTARPQAVATAIKVVDPLRARVLDLSAAVRADVQTEQAAFRSHLKQTVIVLLAVFLVVINIAIGLLLRAAMVVVRPIESLVTATRELGEGHFDYRVETTAAKPNDEFTELSTAVNGMAAKLQTGQTQQMETLNQIARAMNHEINNVVAIIELQLQLLTRQSAAMPELRPRLNQITECLRRMTRVTSALQNARRIVLTDYLPGMKMLDLDQSQLPDPPRSKAAMVN